MRAALWGIAIVAVWEALAQLNAGSVLFTGPSAIGT